MEHVKRIHFAPKNPSIEISSKTVALVKEIKEKIQVEPNWKQPPGKRLFSVGGVTIGTAVTTITLPIDYEIPEELVKLLMELVWYSVGGVVVLTFAWGLAAACVRIIGKRKQAEIMTNNVIKGFGQALIWPMALTIMVALVSLLYSGVNVYEILLKLIFR